jgi:hypothetical protein
MKFTIEVDCTPIEARQFFGFPNVEPMQERILADVEKRMLADMGKFSPEAVLKNWLSFFPQNAHQLQDAFSTLFRQASAASRHEP